MSRVVAVMLLVSSLCGGASYAGTGLEGGAWAAPRSANVPVFASRDPVRSALQGSTPSAVLVRGSAGPTKQGILAFDTLDRGGSSDPVNVARSRNLRAIGLSLLLPGLAQYQAGDRTRGLVHMVAEGALWTAWAGYRIQGNQREDSYVEMAQIFADVDNDDHDDDYWKTIASYPSSGVFDEVIRREARILYGDDLEARAQYLESNRIGESEQWNWRSDADRLQYQEKRSDAQLSYKRSRNMIGLAVVNRVVAMIDAVLATRAPAGLHLEAEPMPDGGRLQIRRNFP